MAEIKYLSLERLNYYDGKIKGYIDAADAATLAAAKEHAVGLGVNYDPAGTAVSKMEELANGAVADNTAAIAKLNGGADVEGSVAKAIADAKGLIDADIAGVEGKADAAQAAAVKAQGEVDALETYVGTFTHETAKTVTEYVDAKVLETSTSADSAVGALTERMVQAEADITELQGNIDGVNAKVTTLIGDDANKSVRTIANEELAKQLIAEGAKESLDTLQEIADWIQTHPGEAAAMNTAIVALQNQMKGIDAGEGTVKKYIDDAIVALNVGQYALAADLTALAGRVTTAEDKITDLEGEAHVHENADVLNGITAAKVSAWDASEQNAKDHADGLNTAMNARVEALEAIDHEHANKGVIDGITAEKVAAWDASEQNAKDYADSLSVNYDPAGTANTKVTELANGAVATNAAAIEGVSGRVAALEAVTHVEISTEEIDNLFT